jgi:hypothetical protein
MANERIVFRGLVWRGDTQAGGAIDLGSGIYSAEFHAWLDEREPGWFEDASAAQLPQPALEAWLQARFVEFDPSALTPSAA